VDPGAGVAFGSVDPRIARAYQLPPLMVSHYDAAAALRQKVGATPAAGPNVDRDVLDRACANAMAIDFGMFKSQVLAYLEPDDQARYDSSSAWDTIVLEVVDTLRSERP
jgi:hypothetical protein